MEKVLNLTDASGDNGTLHIALCANTLPFD